MLIRSISTGFIIIFASFCTFADCPPLDQIKYLGHGSWGAPFYEGFSQQLDKGDTKAVSFLKVEWGRKNGVTTGDGTTLCFYKGNGSGRIMMVQNNWGHVQKPTSSTWHFGYDTPLSQQDAMTAVWICHRNCHFTFD